MNTFDIIVYYKAAFLRGLWVTLKLAMITWGCGLVFGVTLGVLAHRWKIFVGRFLEVFAFVLSGVPFLVLLYWAHYPLQELANVVIDPFYTAAALLVILNTVGVAEICRTALRHFPNEYALAAQVCGLSHRQTVWHIQLPLIFRQILPSILNLQVTMLQMTLFASLISVGELFRVAQEIDSAVHKPIEIYSSLAIFFLLICLPVNGLALWLRKRFIRDLSQQ